MEMTTTTEIICPRCDTELMIETEGLLGGILKQMFIGSLINRAKTEGGIVTCGTCKAKFDIVPKKNS